LILKKIVGKTGTDWKYSMVTLHKRRNRKMKNKKNQKGKKRKRGRSGKFSPE